MPTAPFDATKSLYAGRSIISFTPSGGAAKVFESIKVTHKDNRKYTYVKRPDSAGVLRPVRGVCVEGAEEFIYTVDEAKRLLSDLFSGSLTGIVNGVATIWEPDPSDTGGNVALKSETGFSCQLVRDADVTFGDGKVTDAQIKICSLKTGDVTWTADGAS